eukprot:357063-Rhodomonas_salina.2
MHRTARQSPYWGTYAVQSAVLPGSYRAPHSKGHAHRQIADAPCQHQTWRRKRVGRYLEVPEDSEQYKHADNAEDLVAVKPTSVPDIA